jgi:hypothetical protein
LSRKDYANFEGPWCTYDLLLVDHRKNTAIISSLKFYKTRKNDHFVGVFGPKKSPFGYFRPFLKPNLKVDLPIKNLSSRS